MDVEPAHISQIRQTSAGSFVELSADACTVVADLKAIDRGFGVRFAETAPKPFWAVYHQSDDGRTTSLVATVQAHQNRSGVWEGLDKRIVDRIMQIGHSSYDYVKEVEQKNAKAEADKGKKLRESVEQTGELAAFAIRKDLGVKYKGRIFKP